MSSPRLSLHEFVSQVHADCVAAVVAGPFCHEQRVLLQATVDRLFRASDASDWGQPLGLFYAIYRICGSLQDNVALALGRFSAFYIASADLFDDVQDDDLAGKPHAQAGPAIATNSALTLLTLALDAMGEASELELRADRRLHYLRLFNRVSLVAVAAQHRDLMGARGAQTRDQVELMHRGKTSSIALLCECAALAGGADEQAAQQFYQLGEDLAAAVQVIDDVRDLVAKEESIDLITGKATYPLACFYEEADRAKRERLSQLLSENPIDLNAVRTLLEQEGAFDQCAAAVENHRQRIFERLSRTSEEGPHHRIVAEIVDHLASTLYDPPPRKLPTVRQNEIFHQAVHQAAAEFCRNMSPFGFDRVPTLLPWHLPIYLYVPHQERIYYSDVVGLPEEILPFHQSSFHLSAPAAAHCIQESMPFLIAHELTHAWRDQLGLLGQDAWHEEHIANEIALAYVRKYVPEAARAVVAASQRAVDLQAEAQDIAHQRSLIVARSQLPSTEAVDYDCPPEQAALVHAQMIVEMAQTHRTVEELVARFLPQPQTFVAAE